MGPGNSQRDALIATFRRGICGNYHPAGILGLTKLASKYQDIALKKQRVGTIITHKQKVLTLVTCIIMISISHRAISNAIATSQSGSFLSTGDRIPLSSSIKSFFVHCNLGISPIEFWRLKPILAGTLRLIKLDSNYQDIALKTKKQVGTIVLHKQKVPTLDFDFKCL